MSYYATMTEISLDYPPSSVTRANGGFTKDDDEVIGRWVQLDATNNAVLVADDAKPFGVITRLNATKFAVAVGPFVKGKQSDPTAIPVGSPITGATKVVVSGQTAERGFIKAETGTAIANVNRRVGIVVASAGNAANTQGTAGTEVMMFR